LDAASTGLGYILTNVNKDGSETPLYYRGRSAMRAERNHSTTHLELAALLAALKAFHSYLINTEFKIVTDHISLAYLKNLQSGPSKLARASVQLSQFKFKFVHLAGKKNAAADIISRTKNLLTDALTATVKARHDVDATLDLQLTGRELDDIASCDIGLQCVLVCFTP